jgi:protein FRA10AC1
MKGNPNSTYFSLPTKTGNYRTKPAFALNPYERHKQLVANYQSLLQTKLQKPKSDVQVLHENHQFIHEEEEEDSYENRLAKRYYEKLFKEYCLGDFSRYKTGAIGLRWRTKQECIDAKGQFVCGNLKCSKDSSLSSWEVNFAYMEQGKKKNALVKIRLCPGCSEKLNFKKMSKSLKRPAEEVSPETKRVKIDMDRDIEDKDLESESEEEGGNVWAVPIKEEDLQGQKSKDQEMDDYLNEMFQ